MVDLPMWVYLSLRFWLDICRIIKDIHILWNHGQKHLNKDERKPLSGLDTNSMSNYHEGKAIYISGSVLFMSLEDSTKLPAMVLAWENFQEVFVMLLLLLFFYLTGGFSFIACRRHLSPFRELSPGFYTHFILSAQLIAEWFTTLSF